MLKLEASLLAQTFRLEFLLKMFNFKLSCPSDHNNKKQLNQLTFCLSFHCNFSNFPSISRRPQQKSWIAATDFLSLPCATIDTVYYEPDHGYCLALVKLACLR